MNASMFAFDSFGSYRAKQMTSFLPLKGDSPIFSQNFKADGSTCITESPLPKVSKGSSSDIVRGRIWTSFTSRWDIGMSTKGKFERLCLPEMVPRDERSNGIPNPRSL